MIRGQVLRVEGMTCSACVNYVESALKQVAGVEGASVNLANNTARVEGTADVADLIAAVEGAGYRASLPTLAPTPRDDSATELLASVALTVPIVVISMGWMHRSLGVNLLIGVLTAFVVFGLGRSFFRNASQALANRVANMDLLIAIGSASAWVYSAVALVLFRENPHALSEHLYFETGAVIVTLVMTGRHLERNAKGAMSDAVNKLFALQPPRATKVATEGDVELAINEIQIGDLLRVRPGGQIAVDGVVAEGSSYVDEAMLTGEPVPRQKTIGSYVTAGTVNQNGTLLYRANRIGQDTMLASIIELVDKAQGSKAPIQRLTDKISSIFVPVVIGLATVTGIAVWLTGSTLEISFMRAIAVLVISCPCALGLATPTAIIVGIGAGAKQGILIKDAESLERAAHVKVVVLDKTGTLTVGRPQVVEMETDLDHGEFLRIISSAELPSEHPFGKAIVELARSQNIAIVPPETYQAIPGQGLKATSADGLVEIGPDDFGVICRLNGNTIGRIKIADTVHPDAQQAVSRLTELGVKPVLASGDQSETVEAVAKELGIREVHSRILPAGKAELVTKLQLVGPVGMVGDGINDAPALAKADLSIAMGSGTAIAMESAQITLLRSNPLGIPTAIRLSRATVSTIKWNLVWAFGYNVVMIPLAVLGFLNPMFAAGAMALSSVTVVLNSLRLKSFK
ncbi:MAG: heavy metal translocating P-type ATPase [Fimbriimonadaceae bacterium]